jgi:hypothetical protein
MIQYNGDQEPHRCLRHNKCSIDAEEPRAATGGIRYQVPGFFNLLVLFQSISTMQIAQCRLHNEFKPNIKKNSLKITFTIA